MMIGMSTLVAMGIAASTVCAPTDIHLTNCVALDKNDIVKIYDGDTITIKIDEWYPFSLMAVRLLGYDTPEIRGKCGGEKELAIRAQSALFEAILTADEIVLQDVGRGKYFRIVAKLMLDGEDVADELVGQGLARYYDGGTREGWCDS